MLLCLQMLRSASLGPQEQQDLLRAKYPPVDHIFPCGVGPHVPYAGSFLSPEQTSAIPREISLSALRSAAHPILGSRADPQKLAASWVTNQMYDDTAIPVSGPVASIPGKQALPHVLHVINKCSNSWQCVPNFDAFTWATALTSPVNYCLAVTRGCLVRQANHQQTQMLPMQPGLAVASCAAVFLSPSRLQGFTAGEAECAAVYS